MCTHKNTHANVRCPLILDMQWPNNRTDIPCKFIKQYLFIHSRWIPFFTLCRNHKAAECFMVSRIYALEIDFYATHVWHGCNKGLQVPIACKTPEINQRKLIRHWLSVWSDREMFFRLENFPERFASVRHIWNEFRLLKCFKVEWIFHNDVPKLCGFELSFGQTHS